MKRSPENKKQHNNRCALSCTSSGGCGGGCGDCDEDDDADDDADDEDTTRRGGIACVFSLVELVLQIVFALGLLAWFLGGSVFAPYGG